MPEYALIEVSSPFSARLLQPLFHGSYLTDFNLLLLDAPCKSDVQSHVLTMLVVSKQDELAIMALSENVYNDLVLELGSISSMAFFNLRFSALSKASSL